MDFPSVMKLRKLLSFCIFIIIFCSNNGAIVEAGHRVFPELQSKIAITVDKTLRTGYHFQPPKHWINDPNAPMFFNGKYHLFYQYNPKGAVWGNIVWAHSVSVDLVTWRAFEPAIYPSEPFDIEGCWSGSATIVPDKGPVILYTGLDSQKRQIQNYAVPANLTDPYLRKWNKPAENPLVQPDPSMNASAFRDPTTAWFNNGQWKMVVGSKRGNEGTAELYTSKDFLHWVKSDHPLHSVPNTGMWECPDFYPVEIGGKDGVETSVLGGNVKHVFKVSLDVTRYEYYTIGTYDTVADKYVPDKGFVDGWAGLRYDYGNFYASKSFYDPQEQRRILWGWANESDTVNDDVKKGWAGIQLIPRTILLDPSGQHLIQWPIKEIESKRFMHVTIPKQQLKMGDSVEVRIMTAYQADAEATFSFASLEKAEPFNTSWANADGEEICRQRGSDVQGGVGPFGFLTLASSGAIEEYTPVFFRIFKTNDSLKKHVVLMCSDARPSSTNELNYKPSFGGFVPIDIEKEGNKISLRSLIDNSVVESFGAGGKTCITSRVYPTKAREFDAHFFVFNNGTEPITVESFNGWNIVPPADMNGEYIKYMD